MVNGEYDYDTSIYSLIGFCCVALLYNNNSNDQFITQSRKVY